MGIEFDPEINSELDNFFILFYFGLGLLKTL